MSTPADLVERRLRSFRPEAQPRVRRLAAAHPWIADLASSFPGLLFALAWPRRGFDPRPALRLVTTGAPLGAAAAAGGVPPWLRRFPPEAFAGPIPELPDGPAFRRSIANHLPATWALAPTWIERVAFAAAWADEDIALWIAREAPLEGPKPTRRLRGWRPSPTHVPWRLVTLWAWLSRQPAGKAADLIATRWAPEMAWTAATKAAHAWRDAVALRLYLGEAGVEDTWLAPGEVDGFRFEPLKTPADLEAHAAAMKNCVLTYGSRLAGNDERLWSVWRQGERVATLSVIGGYGPRPSILDLTGPENVQVPPEMWVAARRWLVAQDAEPFDADRMELKHPRIDPAQWRAFWRPLWLAKGRVPAWLPLAPSESAWSSL